MLLAGWGPLLHPLRGVLPLCPEGRDEGPLLRALRFSPDGETVAAASEEDVRVWDAATGRLIGRPFPLRSGEAEIAFTRDGRRLLVVAENNAFHLLDARTGAAVTPAPVCPGPILAAAFTPGGDLLAAGEDRKVRRWPAGAGGAGDVVPLPGEWLAFSEDGALVAVQTAGPAVVVLETAGWRPRGKPLPGKADAVSFGRDGNTVLTTEGRKGTVVWDLAAGTQRGKPLRAAEVVLRPDGRVAAGITEEVTVRLFDTATGEPTGQPLEHVRQVHAVQFAPSGRFVLTWSGDREVYLWGPRTGRPLGRPLLHLNAPTRVAWSPDGRTVATSCVAATAVFLWDVEHPSSAGAPLPHPGGVDRLVVSPDGSTLLTASAGKPREEPRIRVDGGGPRMPGIRSQLNPADEARLWDLKGGKPLGEPLRHGTVFRLAADGKHCLVKDAAGFRLCDVATRTAAGTAPCFPGATVFSPDGRRVVELSRDQDGQRAAARLGDVTTGRHVGPELRHPGSIFAAAFTPDGRTLMTIGGWSNPRLLPIGNWDGSEEYLQKMKRREEELRQAGEVLRRGELRLWDAETGQPRGDVRELPGALRGASFSADGRVALLTGDEGAWWCLDLGSGTAFGEGLRRRGTVRALSADGAFALLERGGGTARVWGLRAGSPAGAPLRNPGVLDQVAFSPDGRLLLIVNEDESARFWDVTSGLPVGPPLPHREVNAVAFAPDGRVCLTAGEDGRVLRWSVSVPIAWPATRVRLWAEFHTGLQTDDTGALDSMTWKRHDELWRQLQRDPP
jgi:WD40 repeat protein